MTKVSAVAWFKERHVNGRSSTSTTAMVEAKEKRLLMSTSRFGWTRVATPWSVDARSCSARSADCAHVEANRVAKGVGEATDDAGDQHELGVECSFGDSNDEAETHD